MTDTNKTFAALRPDASIDPVAFKSRLVKIRTLTGGAVVRARQDSTIPLADGTTRQLTDDQVRAYCIAAGVPQDVAA
jgi:hypothetical protein